MKKDNANTQVFFALLRAGLWKQGVRLQPYGDIDFQAVYDLADEQSVVGLIAAGNGYGYWCKSNPFYILVKYL